MRDRRGLTFLALLAASALCVATVEYRIHRTGDPFYRFLVWNLILAWVPFTLALAAYDRARRKLDLGVVALALSSTLPGTSYDQGMALANRIHSSGRAVVWSGHKEQAELYWESLRGHGLTMAPLEQS